MSNNNSNFPTNQKPDLKPGEMSKTVSLFDDLRQMPPVRNPKS